MSAKEKLAKALADKADRVRKNKLSYYDPYQFQVDLHNDGSRFRCTRSANRIGKCSTISSMIETSDGPKRMGDIFGSDCEVMTYPDLEPRKVMSWIKKPAEECFRIVMSDGQFFECPRNHLILTTSGYVFAEQLFESLSESVFSRPRSNLGIFRLIRAVNGQRYIQRLLNYLGDCFVGYRLDDGQLRSYGDNVQVFAPLQVDVQQHIGSLFCLGALVNRCTNIPLQVVYRLSTLGVYPRALGRFVFSLPLSFSSLIQSLFYDIQNTQLSSSFECHPQPFFEGSSHQFQEERPYLTPITVNGNSIVAVYSIGVHTLYDMEVNERHNYISGGMVHHNTVSGGAEMAFHLTGLYPDWWEGRRFDHPVKGVASGKNNEKTRDLIQGALFGDPADESAWGTGWVPAELIGKPVRKPGIPDAKYHVPVKHVSGKWSKVTLLAYDMGKESWMGNNADVVWLDEEPPEDIMSQAIRSVIDTGGSIYMTFTPENGTTGVVKTVEDQWSMHVATWADVSSDDFSVTVDGVVYDFTKQYTMKGRAGHLSQVKIEDAAKGMKGFEFKMRCNGEPLLGTGQVFGYSEEDFKIDPIEIPNHWRRVAAIDFGGIQAHPTAVVWGAWDEEADIIYVYDAIRVKNKTIAEVSAQIITRPQWIPMIWPHDGNKKLGHDGATKDQYAKFGVNMFHTHFTNPPSGGKEEGKGGILIQPGIDEMNTRMSDGRLKVFSTVEPFFEEYRGYHMKDGKIVDRDDDTIAAVRYLIQSVRHSVVKVVKKRKLNTIPQTAGWM